MKIIGITIDDWKQKAFEDELKKRGFTDFKIIEMPPIAKGTKLIQVFVTKEEFAAKQEEVRRLCVKLQLTLKRMN